MIADDAASFSTRRLIRCRCRCQMGGMKPHTRALIAATTFAGLSHQKVAGLYDHAVGKDLRIAAEVKDGVLQGFDGDRNTAFGGRLPEIHDKGDNAFITFEAEGTVAKGYDRGSATHYEAHLTQGIVQVYDHAQSAWFAYDIQDSDAAQSYHRD